MNLARQRRNRAGGGRQEERMHRGAARTQSRVLGRGGAHLAGADAGGLGGDGPGQAAQHHLAGLEAPRRSDGLVVALVHLLAVLGEDDRPQLVVDVHVDLEFDLQIAVLVGELELAAGALGAGPGLEDVRVLGGNQREEEGNEKGGDGGELHGFVLACF